MAQNGTAISLLPEQWSQGLKRLVLEFIRELFMIDLLLFIS